MTSSVKYCTSGCSLHAIDNSYVTLKPKNPVLMDNNNENSISVLHNVAVIYKYWLMSVANCMSRWYRPEDNLA